MRTEPLSEPRLEHRLSGIAAKLDCFRKRAGVTPSDALLSIPGWQAAWPAGKVSIPGAELTLLKESADDEAAAVPLPWSVLPRKDSIPASTSCLTAFRSSALVERAISFCISAKDLSRTDSVQVDPANRARARVSTY
jgi:hypothetical protein